MEKQNTDIDIHLTDIDLDDDISFYKVSRAVKIIFVGFMFIICFAALGGVFGYGLWTNKTTGDVNDIEIRYECFLRVTKQTPLTCDIKTSGSDSIVSIGISSAYLDKVEVRDITPKPFATFLQNDRCIFCFNTSPGAPGTKTIYFTTVAKKSGKANAIIYTNKQQYQLHQFIYP